MSTSLQYQFDQIPTELVSSIRTLFQQYLQERHPQLSFRGGVLDDLVIELNAVLGAAVEQELQRVRSWGSLQTVLAGDPTQVDAEILDRLLSLYRLERRVAQAASGSVRLRFLAARDTWINLGSLFTASSGQTYRTTQRIVARVSQGSVLGPDDRLLVNDGAGSWVVDVPVQAVDPGVAGNLAAGSTLTLSQPPVGFHSAWVQTALQGGRDLESNAELLARLTSGAAARIWAGQASLTGLLQQQFPTLQALSVCGAGDPVQLRDRHGLIPISNGGRVDVWLRAGGPLVQTSYLVPATLLSKVGSVGTWQILTGRRDSLAGVYRILRVLRAGDNPASAGFAPSGLSQGFDISGISRSPDMVSALEAAYSRYSTWQFTFTDNLTDASALALGTSLSYQLVVLQQPLVLAAQQALDDPAVAPERNDVLVRGAIPCRVQLSGTIRLAAGQVSPGTAAFQQAIAAAVNATGFGLQLTSSPLVSGAQAASPGAALDLTSLQGTLYRPDGTDLALSGTSSLTISPDSSRLISEKTVCFTLSPDDVTLTVL